MKASKRARGKRPGWIGLVAVVAVLGLGACADDDGVYVPPAAEAPAPSRTPETIDELFPETGSRGLLLNRCSTCHAVACAALGQRSAAEWDQVEASHEDYIPGLSIEDRGKIFDYLKRHFNDTLPEPEIPPRLLAGGCPELEP